MKKLVAVLLSCLPLIAFAAGGTNEHVVRAPLNLQDQVSKQRGAQLFVNNCMGCHSLQYQRYSRMADDLGIPREMMMEHLNFTTEQAGDQMLNAMSKKEAAAWFGTAPPDLTMVTRLRSPDWLYSYLLGFYKDESRPFGYNNHVFPSVGMPHVMARMQESVSEDEFKQAMLDITHFLAYTAEPARQDREQLGIYVLLFLAILLIPVYLLKKEYWKDVK